MRPAIKILVINVLVAAIFAADRFLKIFFKKFSVAGEFFIFGDWFKLKLATNAGLAFGLPANYYLILIFYAVILLALAWFLISGYQKKNYFYIFALSLIFAGAFSNLLDRLYWRQVIDYFDLKYYSIFNLADAMIVIGAVGLLLKSLKKNRPSASPLF